MCGDRATARPERICNFAFSYKLHRSVYQYGAECSHVERSGADSRRGGWSPRSRSSWRGGRPEQREFGAHEWVRVNLGRSASLPFYFPSRRDFAIKAPHSRTEVGSSSHLMIDAEYALQVGGFDFGCAVRRCILRIVLAIGVCALTGGLGITTPSRSAELIADLPTPNHLAPAGSRVAANPEADYSYFIKPFKLASQPNLKQSVFGFAGRTNSRNLGDTFAFGVGAPQTRFYDNYIVGGAYQRDFFQFNSGILIGAEIGLADRFGNYKICCDTIAYSNGMTHSAELWGGLSFRHQGVALFDTVRISPGFVFGLSAISNPIGQEGLHQVQHNGSASLSFLPGL